MTTAPIVVERERRGGLWRYRDITGRERAEGNVLAREEQVRAAAEEALGAGVLVADLDGVMLDADSRMGGLTGYALGEIVGRKVHELPPPRTSRGSGGLASVTGYRRGSGTRRGLRSGRSPTTTIRGEWLVRSASSSTSPGAGASRRF